jgi:fused signal recognition particle receptor
MDSRPGTEQEALRIQAAAVAAQQAALNEAEARVQQQRLVLEQQEEQLAAHLEEKRVQLVELRHEVQTERTALRTERTAYMRQVGQMTRQLEAGRHEVAAGKEESQKERDRLRRLRERVKNRWRRHCAAEQQALDQRERRLEAQARQQEKERKRLAHDQEALQQQRLRWNGEHELDRRELQAVWTLLQEEQRHWQQRKAQDEARIRAYVAQLEQREAHLAADQQNLEGKRQTLKKEADGLETRIQNQRRRIQEQEQEVVRLNAVLQELQGRLAQPEQVVRVELPPLATPEPSDRQTEVIQEAEAALQERVAELDALAGDLADQRLHLAEQSHRLAQAQERWERDRDTLTAELDALGRRLQEREHVLEIAEARFRQHEDEMHQQRRRLDVWQADLVIQTAAWEGERDRLLADQRNRENLLQKGLATIEHVRRQWQQRHQQSVDRLRAEYAACENLRQEYTVLRQEWQRQNSLLGEKERHLAQQILAIEQYRQRFLQQTANVASGAKKLERLRRRWASLAAAAERHLARDRQTLAQETARLEDRFRQVRDLIEEVHSREAGVSTREVALEHDRTLADLASAKLRQDVEVLQAQRSVFEQQVKDLQDEVDRLARLLMDERNTPSPVLSQAA